MSHLRGDGVAVLDDPLLAACPFREVLAVEQDDGVRRRAVVLAGRDDLRLRPDDAALVLLLSVAGSRTSMAVATVAALARQQRIGVRKRGMVEFPEEGKVEVIIFRKNETASRDSEGCTVPAPVPEDSSRRRRRQKTIVRSDGAADAACWPRRSSAATGSASRARGRFQPMSPPKRSRLPPAGATPRASGAGSNVGRAGGALSNTTSLLSAPGGAGRERARRHFVHFAASHLLQMVDPVRAPVPRRSANAVVLLAGRVPPLLHAGGDEVQERRPVALSRPGTSSPSSPGRRASSRRAGTPSGGTAP